MIRTTLGAAALAFTLVAISSAGQAAPGLESCSPAPVIEDSILREDLGGKAEYLKWMATSPDDARKGLDAMLEAYRPGDERQIAVAAVQHTICVMVRDPESELSPTQREVLGSLLPDQPR